MKDDYCANWPKWLRYLLVFPATIICSFLACIVAPFICCFYLDKNSWGYAVTYQISGAFALVGTALFLLYTLPPKHKLWFMMIPNVIWFVLVYFEFILMFNYSYAYDWTDWVSMITETLTCIIMACVAISDNYQKRYSAQNTSYEFIKERADSIGISPEEYIQKVKASEKMKEEDNSETLTILDEKKEIDYEK